MSQLDQQSAPATTLPATPPSATILIVEDEPNLRLLLCHAIANEGYNVLEAPNGEACLAVCQNGLPDLILLDAIMPAMDGFACCEALHQQFGDSCPPILITTALSDSKSVDRAFAAGAVDFVTKPIHWAVLRQRVQRILQSRWIMLELYSAREQVAALTQQLAIAQQELQKFTLHVEQPS